jgi:hypothetical protein
MNNNNEKIKTRTNGHDELKKFKTHMKHLMKYLNQCFQQDF